MMKVSLVLVFVFSTINLMVLDAQIIPQPARPLRIQISGVCTKSVIEKIPRTQIVTKVITQKCPNSKNVTCRITKNLSYKVSRPITKTKITEICCPGYSKTGAKCEPICTVPCDNGLCTQPNFCTCFPQYRKISEYHCAPICDDCHHGICIFPNVCRCFVNYNRHVNGTCVPVCKNECINSECTSPDTCSCHEGYVLSKQQNNRCTPICNLPCGKGGVCHEPDLCLCTGNYRLNETNQCEPVCKGCGNGVCTDPGVCVCNENYRLVRTMGNETRCELMRTTTESTDNDIIPVIDNNDSEEMTSDYDDVPNEMLEYFTTPRTLSYRTRTIPPLVLNTIYDTIITTSMVNSYSTTPQVINVNETNENQCVTECVNGECADGYCLCDEGYYDSELIPNHCDPICEFHSADGCINGTCVAPNTCECYDDFMAISDHVCIPVLKNSDLVMDHNRFVKSQTGIKDLTNQLVHYLFGTLAVLVLVTIITFIIYKWYNRRLSYHLHSTEEQHFGAQYMAEDDGCEL